MARGRLARGAHGMPVGRATRPTTARVREAIFDTLFGKAELVGASVLDLFAGTGSLGFEAGARGAASVVFVERDHQAAAALRRSTADPRWSGRSDFTVVERDALAFLASSREIFDICFCDPPYRFTDWDKVLAFAPGRLVVAESDRDIPGSNGYGQTTLKRYGDTWVSYLRLDTAP